MTTTLPFNFRIDNIRQRVDIGPVGVDIPSSLLSTNPVASNIKFIMFSAGQGEIEYNDRIDIPETFTDPSPYQAFINQWMTTASVSVTPPLTLAQAQAIKCGLIGAIFSVKRTTPVTVSVSGTSHQWDASDQAVARMSAIASLAYISDLNSTINSFNADIASLVTAINTNVDHYNTLNSNVNGFPSNLQNDLNSWVSLLNTTEQSGPGGSGWALVGNPTVPSITTSSESHVTFTGPSDIVVPTIQALPFGETALVTLQPSDVKAIMQAIATQNATMQLANATKQAAVNALTLMSDVIAYDATTGW